MSWDSVFVYPNILHVHVRTWCFDAERCLRSPIIHELSLGDVPCGKTANIFCPEIDWDILSCRCLVDLNARVLELRNGVRETRSIEILDQSLEWLKLS